jgi:hypothetical protein
LTWKKIQIFASSIIFFVDVNAKELNVVLSSRGQAQVDEDDNNNVITVEDCNGVDDE